MRVPSMYLVQILVPLYDNDRLPFPSHEFVRLRAELTDEFGGLTVYTRAPAEGLWRQNGNETSRDDIVIFEVMAPELDTGWWGEYRHGLQERFRQNIIIIRAQQTQLL